MRAPIKNQRISDMIAYNIHGKSIRTSSAGFFSHQVNSVQIYRCNQFVSVAQIAHTYLSTMPHNKIVTSEKSISMKVSRSGGKTYNKIVIIEKQHLVSQPRQAVNGRQNNLCPVLDFKNVKAWIASLFLLRKKKCHIELIKK